MKSIIFDLDGTLLDTLDDLATSANHALQSHGYPIHPIAAYRYFVGNGIHMLIQRALPEKSQDQSTVRDVTDTFLTHYNDHASQLTQPYQGIITLLQDLHSKGYLLSIASNKYHEGTLGVVKHYFSEEIFTLVFGHREGYPAKPDPAIVHEICAKLEISEEDCLYVGDSDVDMQTAKRAGVIAVGVTWGFRTAQELLDQGADYLIDTPEQLHTLLEELA